MPGPRAIVYRTVTDVGDAVPIALSPDGAEIVSYPHPSDLLVDGQLRVPSPLADGYLLDNRGIGPNAAFLKWSYSEYAAFDHAPTLAELQAAISVREPIAEMYDCGLRHQYKDPVKELDEIISTGTMPKRCKRLK